MIHELRIYHCLPGRLPALIDRFERTTLGIWERFGIRPVGFWTTLVGPSNLDLTYMLAWESMAERQRKWDAFRTDPDWLAALAASERDGQITAQVTNMFLQPTAFSPLR